MILKVQLYPSGHRIAGRYEVAGAPLMGGMGIVYLCFDHQEQRPVALKTFRPEYLPDRATRDRFLQEGETWVRLGKNPHIVRCYQVFQDSPRPEVFLVLELIAKEESRRDASLRSWLTPGRPLPIDQALLIALQIVRGMQHATKVIPGFVHRDLKPENVLVGADRLSNAPINRVRVTDFGLVNGLRDEQMAMLAGSDLATQPSRLTQVGAVVGTPQYMAPEQWAGADVTILADIYALGCMMGEMVTGRMLVQGQTLDGLRRAHQGGQALTAARVAPAVLTDLLNRCLAVEPTRRYAGWDAVEAELDAAYRTATGQPSPVPKVADALNRAERVAAGWSYSAMGGSYLDIGNAQAALGNFERAHLSGQTEGERELAAAGLNHLGVVYRCLGDVRTAIGYHKQAVAIYREICAASTKGSKEWTLGRRGEGAVLSSLGNAFADLGDARQAIGLYEDALVIHREIGDRVSQGIDLGNLGEACRELGDARRAIWCYEQALSIHQLVSDHRGEGNALGNLGSAYLELGDTRQAIRYCERALAIRRKIGDRRGEGIDLGNLGEIHRRLGEIQQAIRYFEYALAIRREISDRRGERNDLGNLGNTYVDLGDVRRAIWCYEQALAIDQEIGDRRGESIDLGNLGIVYGQLGETRRAIGFYETALAIRREIGDRRGEGNDLGNLASAYGQLGDSQRAIRYFEEALVIRREVDDRRGEGNDLGKLGSVYLALGDMQQAIRHYEQALTIRRAIGDRYGEGADLGNLALLYTQLGDQARALPLAREAARLFTQVGQAAYAQRLHGLITELERQG